VDVPLEQVDHRRPMGCRDSRPPSGGGADGPLVEQRLRPRLARLACTLAREHHRQPHHHEQAAADTGQDLVVPAQEAAAASAVAIVQASTRNGMASAAAEMASSAGPTVAVWLAAAAASRPARTGPIHGVQPRANAAPSGSANAGPLGTRCRLIRRRSRLSPGSRRRARYQAHGGDDQHVPPLGLALLEGAGRFELDEFVGVGFRFNQPGDGGGAEGGRDVDLRDIRESSGAE
jgi:hypothetical protein